MLIARNDKIWIELPLSLLRRVLHLHLKSLSYLVDRCVLLLRFLAFRLLSSCPFLLLLRLPRSPHPLSPPTTITHPSWSNYLFKAWLINASPSMREFLLLLVVVSFFFSFIIFSSPRLLTSQTCTSCSFPRRFYIFSNNDWNDFNAETVKKKKNNAYCSFLDWFTLWSYQLS